MNKKYYYILPSLNFGPNVFNIKDGSNRIFDFFILNKNNGKFLEFTKPILSTPEEMDLSKIKETDFYPVNISVPLFSERAYEFLSSTLINEVLFFECETANFSLDQKLFLAKIINYLPLIDKEKTEYRTLRDGDKIPISYTIKLVKTDNYDFLIARDIEYPSLVVVSEEFVSIYKKNDLYADFIECG